jgi:hypothetical protein
MAPLLQLTNNDMLHNLLNIKEMISKIVFQNIIMPTLLQKVSSTISAIINKCIDANIVLRFVDKEGRGPRDIWMRMRVLNCPDNEEIYHRHPHKVAPDQGMMNAKMHLIALLACCHRDMSAGNIG